MKQSSLPLACVMILASVCLSCSPTARKDGAPRMIDTAPPRRPAEEKNQSAIEQAVLENEKKIWEAFKTRDADIVNDLMADDATLVTPDGRFTKSDFLRMVSQFPAIPSYSIDSPLIVSPSKDVAILSYRSTYIMKEPEEKTYSAFQTTIWVNRDGKWVAVFNQETQGR
ncbi:MAG TPA: nuclear transport factor 2 family protein [Pyrinomonadaceae bacterium]|nr:nuclear transport factor 2 family protein [Pyrinomonadaceae bacterium]